MSRLDCCQRYYLEAAGVGQAKLKRKHLSPGDPARGRAASASQANGAIRSVPGAVKGTSRGLEVPAFRQQGLACKCGVNEFRRSVEITAPSRYPRGSASQFDGGVGSNTAKRRVHSSSATTLELILQPSHRLPGQYWNRKIR